jgi:murein endopeptidase
MPAALLVLLSLACRPVAAQAPADDWLEEADDPELIELSDDPEELWSWCYKKALRDGVQLPRNTSLYKRWHPEKAWGTAEMIETLTSAAEEMAWLMPEADPIVVGDISTKRGGRLDGHKSHRGGVDADIGLYWGDGQMYMQGFMNVSARDLDAEANWQLIRAMLETGHVERILLDNSLVRVLRRHVVRQGYLTQDEAWQVFPTPATGEMWRQKGVVHHSPGHRHHMHVRVNCPVVE